jgi:drug/metabolite transporter (DMT)-like permease
VGSTEVLLVPLEGAAFIEVERRANGSLPGAVVEVLAFAAAAVAFSLEFALGDGLRSKPGGGATLVAFAVAGIFVAVCPPLLRRTGVRDEDVDTTP